MRVLSGTTIWHRLHRDERGSLPMAMLVILVGMALAALLIPMVISQNSVTRFDVRRAQSLQAAEAGLDVALGLIRSASDADGNGVPSKLPCNTATGTVAGTDGGSYSVSIAYYVNNPSGQGADWQQANAMTCSSGYGVFDKPTDSFVPSFALLTSTGTDGSTEPGRTLQATYVFKTTNSNIAGGALPMFSEPNTTDSYCMDAGSPIRVGNAVGLQACPSDPTQVPDQQKWAYNQNLSLQLTATIGDTTLNPDGTGLCLDTSSSTHNAGVGLVVEPCALVPSGSHKGAAVWNQEWSIDDSAHFEGAKSDYSDIDGWCIDAASQPVAQLTLQTCAGGTTDPSQAWNPTPTVGAGQAGATNGQLVNFLLFGRCLDVTNQSVDTGDNGGSFLILYPCKQNPDPTKVAWNQRWTSVPIPGGSTVQWRTYYQDDSSQPYCLTSPGSAGGDVYVSSCSSVNKSAANQAWKSFAEQDADGNQLSYSLKYTVQDSTGLCLAQGPNDDQYNDNLKVIVTGCDGTAGEKWNADPNVQVPMLSNLRELTGTAGG